MNTTLEKPPIESSKSCESNLTPLRHLNPGETFQIPTLVATFATVHSVHNTDCGALVIIGTRDDMSSNWINKRERLAGSVMVQVTGRVELIKDETGVFVVKGNDHAESSEQVVKIVKVPNVGGRPENSPLNITINYPKTKKFTMADIVECNKGIKASSGYVYQQVKKNPDVIVVDRISGGRGKPTSWYGFKTKVGPPKIKVKAKSIKSSKPKPKAKSKPRLVTAG